MLKINWNKKYTTYAIYAGIVSAAVIVCIFIGVYISDVWSGIVKVFDVLAPLIYGIATAYILNPLLKIFEKSILRKIKNRMLRRGIGVLLTYAVFLAALVFLVYLVIPQFVSSFRELEGSLAKYSQSLQDWLSDISQQAGFLADIVKELEKHIDFSFFSSSVGELIGVVYKLVVEFSPHILGFLQAFAAQVIKIVVGLVFAGYLLCSKELLFAQLNKLLHVLFKSERIAKIKSGVGYVDKTFGKYIMGALLDAIFVGCITALGMFILSFITGMPRQYIALISVIVACTNIIPVFGPFIGGVPSAVIIFIADPVNAFWFVALIIVLQQIDGNFVAPRIYGSTTGLPALYVIIAITVMGGLFGVVGMIIGVPVFAIIGNAISRKTNKRISEKKAEIESGVQTTSDGYAAEDYEDFEELEAFYNERPSITDDGDIELSERFGETDDDEAPRTEVEEK